MTFRPKPSYLPEDMKEYEAPERHTHHYLAVLAACLAIVAYVEPIAAPQAAASVGTSQKERYAVPAASAATLLAACMNGGAISWRDPHTDDAMLTVCDTHKVAVK